MKELQTAERDDIALSEGFALLFAPGERPDAEAIVRHFEARLDNPVAASVSFRPPPEEGWLEVLASGLAFDVTGLEPAMAAAIAEPKDRYGFEPGAASPALGEAIVLGPGMHIAGGSAMLPILRVMAGLAADLALALPVRGVVWGPADTLMAPAYFSRAVLAWLGGGAFPALGLSALRVEHDGSVASRGLAHFTGQELRVEARAGESPAQTVKVAIRIADFLVRNGPMAEPGQWEQGGETWIAEPSQFGRQVWVWRKT